MTPNEAPPDPVEAVRSAQFVLLTTFKRDGTPVPTPVWAAAVDTTAGRGIRIWTGRDSGKVKRIRVGKRVEVAPCTRSGTPLGPAVEARARLLDEHGTRETLAVLRGKYGLLGRVLLGRAAKRLDRSVGIEVVLDAAASEAG